MRRQLLITEVYHYKKYSTDKIVKMAKLKVTQVRSKIGSTERVKRTLKALGLSKISSTIVIDSNPELLGMIRKVNHLVKIQEVKE